MLRTSCNSLSPLLLAGLGGMITAKVGILNLGLEGMMLLGAFGAVLINFFTGSPMLGLLGAMAICSIIGLVFALFNIKWRVNNMVMSVGINMFAIAITKYLLRVMFGASGAFTSDKIVKMQTVPLPFLDGVPVLRVLSGLSIVFWLALLAMFTNGMTSGRGFLGNIASIMGNRTALGTALGSLLFSVTDGATMKIQTFGFPSQLVQLIPYVVAFCVIILNALLKRRRLHVARKRARLGAN